MRMDEDLGGEATEVKRHYHLKPNAHWTGKSLKGIAREVRWVERYDFVYGTYSEVIHASITGSHGYVRIIPGDTIMVGPQPHMNHADACLREAYFYVVTMCGTVDILLNLGIEDLIEDAWVEREY